MTNKHKLTALLLVVSCNVFSQKDTTHFKKEIFLEEILISANRSAEPLKNIAQQNLILTTETIQELNQLNTANLLEQTGNVFVQKSQPGGGSPVIRGFEANKILIVVDGVRMNNAIYRGGHLQNILTIDNAIVDRAEILYGPSSVIYGSDALGGIISFYTKNPILSDYKKAKLTGNAMARYASAFDGKTLHADFNIANKSLGALTSFTFSDFGDLRQGKKVFDSYPDWGKRFFYTSRLNNRDTMLANTKPHIQKVTGYKQYDLLQKLLWNTGSIKHLINFQYSTTTDIPRYDRLTETTNARFNEAEWYYGPQKRLMAAYQLQLPASAWFDSAIILPSFQAIEESRHNRKFNNVNLNNRMEKVKVYALNIDLNKLIKRHQLHYGLEAIANTINSTADKQNIETGLKAPLDTRYPAGGSNTSSFGLYLTHTKSILNKVILNDGVRVSYTTLSADFSDTLFFKFPFNTIQQKSTAVTGNLGLVILPAKGLRLTPLISTDFRSPNVDDLTKVFESTGGRLIVPNAELKPERTYNVELGISKSFNEKITISILAFYTKYYNALVTDSATFNGQKFIEYAGKESAVFTTVNKAVAFVKGLSSTLTVVLSKHVKLSSSLNYT
ncbi:MAG: TonB-dependent receptor, partial [Ginsengibacter sp.]